MDWPGALDAAEEIDLETRRAPDAPVHRTTVWPAVEDGEVYVRSLRGENGRWYREISANPDAAVIVDGESIPVRAEHAPDDESVERASAGLRRKYADSPSLDSMLTDDNLRTTLRLVPR
jgi:hypothetical protein